MKTPDVHIIRTKDLSIGYHRKSSDILVASDININLKQGQLIGLVGANGIGKSTFLRTLSKVQSALSGDIYLNDIPLNRYSNIELAKTMSLVLTEGVASKNLTVFELVALGRHPYTNWVGNLTSSDIEISKKAIEQARIQDLTTKKCFELSDGQLQKVMLARALAQDTDVIILDEPTTHLDMYHKAYILNLLKKLVDQTGKTILFSSHEIDLAIQLCDTMIVMTQNQVFSDSPKNLIEQKVFEDLFPDDLIIFDERSGGFRVKN